MVRRSQLTNKLSDIEEANTDEVTRVVNQDDDIPLDASLDDLFTKLKESTTTQATTHDEIDEFTKIKKTVSKLPKLEDIKETLSGVEKQKGEKEYLRSAKIEGNTLNKRNITHLNDPILMKEKAKEESNDAGSKWFNMPKGELTESTKRDLKIIQQRAALDPKRHYKKQKWKAPDYFQVGTIVEGNTEFFSSRLQKKQRHETILESVLHDQDTKHYFKRKYDEIQVKKRSGKKGDFNKLREGRRKF